MFLKMQLGFFIFALSLNQRVFSQTTVRMYKNGNYGGDYMNVADLDNINKRSMGSFNDKMTSYRITSGSCVKMYDNDPPGSSWFSTTSDSSNVGSYWNDRVSSVSGCGKYSKSIQCPSGQFVKKISYSSSLRSGIEIHCYQPKSSSQSSSYRSHSSGTLPYTETCTVFRGIKFYRDSTRKAHTGLGKTCTQESSSGYNYACSRNQALVGLNLEVENYYGFVKSAGHICRDVGRIESTCVPTDELTLLFTCDASKLTSQTLKCDHSMTIGYGLSKNQTQDQHNEQAFYVDAGFLLDSAGSGLSANFKSAIGSKSTTGYNWSTTPTSTFSRETSVTVRTEAPPGCITKVFQVVGECGFLEARPNYYYSVSNCFGPVNN